MRLVHNRIVRNRKRLRHRICSYGSPECRRNLVSLKGTRPGISGNLWCGLEPGAIPVEHAQSISGWCRFWRTSFSSVGCIDSSDHTHLGCVPEFRGIAGYSLAGLFALWAVYQTALFDRAASISGSLWFDGFLDFMRANTPKAKLVYLSLGDREKAVKNPRLAAVEDCTVQAVELLRAQGVSTIFEMN